MGRMSLAQTAQGQATRTRLLEQALDHVNRAAMLPRPRPEVRTITLNGQVQELDLSDIAELRGRLVKMLGDGR